MTLERQVLIPERFPTPVAYDAVGHWESNNYHGLGWLARNRWPTPRASGGPTVYLRTRKDGGKNTNLEEVLGDRCPETVGGKLNPTWVEWLMGFPLEWTALED